MSAVDIPDNTFRCDDPFSLTDDPLTPLERMEAGRDLLGVVAAEPATETQYRVNWRDAHGFVHFGAPSPDAKLIDAWKKHCNKTFPNIPHWLDTIEVDTAVIP